MTSEDFRKRAEQLSQALSAAIRQEVHAFQQDTGVQVTGISVQLMQVFEVGRGPFSTLRDVKIDMAV